MRWSFGQPAEPSLEDLEPPDDEAASSAARELPAGSDDEPGAWDTEETRRYGDVVARRFHVVRVPWVDACEAWRSGSDRIERFAGWVLRAAETGERVAPRLDVREVDAPAGVRRGLESCQKPFQLWNVERIEEVAPFTLKPVPPLRVGQAAELSEEQRPPRRIDKATRTLVELLEERAFRALLAEKSRAQHARIWMDPLPFGRPDDEEPGGRSRVISVEELMAMQGGGPAPPPQGRRPPSSAPPAGGFSLDQPDDDDDDDDDDDGRGPPRGGFSLEQPDDD